MNIFNTCILNKTRKIIELIRKLQTVIPRAALLTTCKSFLRPRLDYGDVIYDCAFKKSFGNKLFNIMPFNIKQILKFIRSSPNSTFNVHNSHRIKLLTRLRVALSHLGEHKFKHDFQDSLNRFGNCSKHIETTIHFFPHCWNYSSQRKTLIKLFTKLVTSNVHQIDPVSTSNAMFQRTIWDKLPECIFESFEFARVKWGQF